MTVGVLGFREGCSAKRPQNEVLNAKDVVVSGEVEVWEKRLSARSWGVASRVQVA